jgi:hypothetical protein
MNMPIGYYTGISLDFFIGKLTNIIPANFLNETMEWNGNGQYGYGSYSTYNKTNPNKIEFPFMVTGYNFNLFLGKNTYLGKNITLDIFTKLGLGYFSFKPTNFTAYPSAPFGSSITEPNRVGGNASGAYSVYDKVEGVYYIKRGGFNLFPDFYSYPIHKALKPNGYSPSGENIWGYYIYSGSNKPYTYHRIKLIVYPQIKIGYLF